MLEIEQNIEEVESWDPGAGGKVPPGVYEVQIDAVEVKTSTSGFPKLAMKLRVVQGEHLGGIVFGDRSLHPNALPYFRGLLDVLNVYASGKKIDEQRLVGRFMKVQVVEYDKNNGEKGVSAEKFFKSDISAGKNDQLDITAISGGTVAGEKAAQRPPQKAGGTNGSKPGNGQRPSAPIPQTPPPSKGNDEDLPF